MINKILCNWELTWKEDDIDIYIYAKALLF